jgi:hypothetical protein
MKTFRYDTSGQWYKGNTHLHSNASDGGCSFQELAALYHSAGYDFLFRTDHWVASDTQADAEPYPLLWLDGIELDGKDLAGTYFHVACLGRVNGIRREDGFEAALHSARRQGALAILAHPHWCGNSLEDCRRWQFDGVEVYNHICHWLNGKGGGLVHWDAALMLNPNTLASAVDDAHLTPEHPGWNGGWIVVNAPTCRPDEIMSGIRRGNFYSSCGPQLHSVTLDGDQLHVEMSPVRCARLVGPGPRGKRIGYFDGQLVDSVSFPIPDEWRYVYLEVEDQEGRRAWTNPLFVTDGLSDKPDARGGL